MNFLCHGLHSHNLSSDRHISWDSKVRYSWRIANGQRRVVLRRTPGADGRLRLAVGQRLHVHPIRLEGGAGSRRQRDGRQLHASEAPATPSEERSNAGLPMVVVVVHFGLLGGRWSDPVRSPSDRVSRAFPDVPGLHVSL